MPETTAPPQLLCLSGHDPTGGAGIQADIEAAAANGAHACGVISCLTEQDSCDVYQLLPQPPGQVLAHARRVLADGPIAAVKIGLLGDAALALALGDLLAEHPTLPVVLDPVLASGTGTELAGTKLVDALRLLLPRIRLLTPNSLEARRLAGTGDDLDRCAARLLGLGTKAVLITGTHEQDPSVVHRLYQPNNRETWNYPRLEGSYHGSGCTLASAIAARIATGESLHQAVATGLDYTWRTLEAGWRTGRCQRFPDRLFRLRRGTGS